MSKIQRIKISDLIPFSDNPFKKTNELEMQELTESISDFGIITPLVVRRLDNKFEIISGHRRWQAAMAIGMPDVPATVEEMSNDEAVIRFVDFNLQREKVLPSEKAFAYKMKYDAMKRQGFRSDITSYQLGTKFRSDEELAKNASDSRTQIQRYIRLTYLQEPLLKLVDEGRIALTPAVELSFLTEEEQLNLIETIESEDATPSLSQAQRMKKLSEDGKLSMDKIFEIVTEKKGNQTEYLKIPLDRIRKYFAPTVTQKQMEDYMVKAIDYYSQVRKRSIEKER